MYKTPNFEKKFQLLYLIYKYICLNLNNIEHRFVNTIIDTPLLRSFLGENLKLAVTSYHHFYAIANIFV